MIYPDRSVLVEAGFREIDIFFAEFISGLAGDSDPVLKGCALCVSYESGSGHVCLDLKSISSRDISEVISDSNSHTGMLMPSYEKIEETLRDKKRVVGSQGEQKPLIIDGSGRLYLQRYHRYEQMLSERLIHFISGRRNDLDEKAADKIFADYFMGSDDAQIAAAALSVSGSMLVVSGGPGTGKTSTVVKIIFLLYSLFKKNGVKPGVALAAPTGKAAARLKESFDSASVSAFSRPVGPDVKDFFSAIPSTTIHRLLRQVPGTPFFRYNREQRLPHDIVVVDEFSMADIALASKLFDSLRDDARIILLGDRNQLSSVESGSVLADICDASVSPAIFFKKSYRFGSDSGIGAAADLIRDGDAPGLVSLLKSGRYDDIRLLECGGRFAANQIPQKFFSSFKSAIENIDPVKRLDEMRKQAFLCAHRKGLFGVESLNRMIEERLSDEGIISRGRRWYNGRPLMIKSNSPGLGLYNGDTGVIVREGPDDYAFFYDGVTVRKYHPSRLPEHETAFAMTIHKSQGSEFDDIFILLPSHDSAMLTRELLYTAVTRGRRSVTIIGSEEALLRAVNNRVYRNSGLKDALERDAKK